MPHMTNDRNQGGSDLFLLRLWNDRPEGSASYSDDAQREEDTGQRGRLLNMLNGEGHNFESWEGLVNLLRGMHAAHSTEESVSEVSEGK
jgi:hypothetical protein